MPYYHHVIDITIPNLKPKCKQTNVKTICVKNYSMIYNAKFDNYTLAASTSIIV